ncbi:MAG: DMT family transporter, partial [Candidatus Heimdallarchaeota archaeon]|nr:DMT family transporter [Candidatus Heimdallarchaeota archaeon]
WLILIGSITFTVIIGDTCFFEAQKQIGTSLASGIATISPFFTYILALIFLDQEFSYWFILSTFLVIIGVYLITKSQNESNGKQPFEKLPAERMQGSSRFSQKKYTGIILSIISAVSWSIGMILTDYGMNRADEILHLGTLTIFVTNTIRYIGAAVILGILALRRDSIRSSDEKHTKRYLLLSVVVSVGFGSYFFGESARIAGAALLSLMSTALPLFIIPFAYFINKERIKLKGFIGILITIAGVIIVIV